MKNKKHLPMMGVGPFYVAVIIAMTILAVIVGRDAAFEKVRIDFLKTPLLITGILLIILGVYLWAGAMFRSKIDSHIAKNRLATTGVYALVRNPIYSAFMFFCTDYVKMFYINPGDFFGLNCFSGGLGRLFNCGLQKGKIL